MKAKRVCLLRYGNQLVMTPGALLSKAQPPPLGFFLLVKRENEFGYEGNRLMGIKILYYSMVVTDNRFNFVIRQFSGLTLVDNQLLAGLCRSQLRSHQMTL